MLDLGDGGGAGEGELGDGLQLVRLLVLVGGRIALQNPWLGSLGLGFIIIYIYIYIMYFYLSLRTHHLQEAIKDMFRTA